MRKLGMLRKRSRLLETLETIKIIGVGVLVIVSFFSMAYALALLNFTFNHPAQKEAPHHAHAPAK